MNKAEFITLIDNPQTLDKSHITALKNIASDFPYFQAGHILLTKALFNENHYEYEKQLRTTALLVSNRELLYRFLHDLNIEGAQKEIEQIVSIHEEIDIVTEVNEEDIIAPPVIDEPIAEDIAIITLAEEPAIVEEPIEEVVPVTNTTEQIPEIDRDKNEVHSFTEWLALSGNRKIADITGVIAEALIETAPQEIEKEVSEPAISEEIREVLDNADENPKTNLHQFESILDKFIRENPRISRPKAEFYKPANVAKQSIEEDDDLVTETLADIYYRQGAYKKAVRAYEKLCLIYPHKMSYFAALIQKIKEENKND